MKKRKVSKALRDVWAWKDACYRDVAHLPPGEALRQRIADAERSARELGFATGNTVQTAAVAEAPANYSTRKPR